MKKMGRVLAVIMTLVMLLAMLPASAMAAQTTINGTYTDGTWTAGGDGSITHNVNGTNVTLSKTATAVAENVFDITLQVQTSTTTTSTIPGGAVVLVIDTSSSMTWCSECGSNNSHNRSCVHYNSSSWQNSVTVAQQRITAAKAAARTFLSTYAGTVADASRMLAIVTFDGGYRTSLDWVNVAGGAGSNSYDTALNTINDLNTSSGTCMDGGLYTALNLLDDSEVAGIAKNVVLLSDGAPSTRMNNSNIGPEIADCTAAAAQATAIKNTGATLYTVCFGAANEEAYGGGPTVGNFLRDSVATSAAHAYNADSSDELNAAFEAIGEDITSGLTGDGWTATDPMGDLVSVSGSAPAGFTSDDGETYTWTLSNPSVSTSGNTTTYTYTITYRVTLDVLDPAFQAGIYYPTNEPTYLNIGDEQYAFPVPGVQGQKLNFVLHKIDETNKMPLSGVAFTLTHTCGNNCTSSTAWGPYYGISDANGAIAFADASGNALNGLPSGHTYTLTEAEYEGYQPNDPVQFTVSNGTLTETEDKEYFYPDQSGFVMENIPYTSATVVKVWDDANDQDGKRPDSLTVTLSNGQSVTLTAANNWTATIEELPYYAADGSVITYTWTEGREPEGYKLTNTSVNGTVTTLTNTHVPEVTSATVTKVWDDADNQDGKRPESLIVTLSNGQTVTLNEANEWTATIENLPVYANGQVITYTWTEGEMPEGYSLTNTSVNGNVTTLTNSYTPETTSVSVAKVWDDADNQDGKRPESLTVTLSNGQTVTLNEGNGWTATIDNLPVYANGQVIEYTWTEGEMPEGYMLTNTSVNGTITTLTNSYEPEETSVTVTKVWDDADNQDGKRPESLNVTLSNGMTVTLNEANEWTATIDNLPVYANGQVITYTWTEGDMPEGYALTNTSVNGTITTLTNSYEPEETSVTVTKVWDDADNQDGKRPESLTVTLSNGMAVTLNESNEWTATIDNLPVYENGSVIEYTWTEGEMPEGYVLTNTSVNGTITTLTNSYEPELTTATVVKVWDDANDQDGMRPDELVVELSNGTQVTLNVANSWTATVENLPAYANGALINYTWSEVNVPEGYSLTSTSVNGTVTTLTNSHVPGVNTISGSKTWVDNNNQDHQRPDSITIYLLQNGTQIASQTVTAADGWSWTFTNLPLYENGVLIAYSIQEAPVENYTAAYDGYNVTNTYHPVTIDIPVQKIWIDDDNQRGKRPAVITVGLLVNGVHNGQYIVLDESNGWAGMFYDLPVYQNGVEIQYGVFEAPVDGYISDTAGNNHDGFVVVNQIDLTPPKTGDNSNIALWLALMSASALCFVLISKRRSA